MTDPNSELKEQLAAIEHERWPNGKKKYARNDAQRKHNAEWTRERWARATLEERERRRIRNREYYQLVRRETLEAYGNRCVCCGESNDSFLSLDHVNDDGNLHRSQLSIVGGGDSKRLYAWQERIITQIASKSFVLIAILPNIK